MTNTSHKGALLVEGVPTEAPARRINRKALRMSYAAPFYYAAKALEYDRYVPGQHPRPMKQRRRRIRLMLFPALRPTRSTTSVAPAASSGSR